jgi:hypothetical protein
LEQPTRTTSAQVFVRVIDDTRRNVQALALRTAARSAPRRQRPLVQRRDDLVRIRPSAAEQARQETPALARDDLAVRDDVELARRSLPDLDLEPQLLADLRGETRRAPFEPSSRAVQDLDLHRARDPTRAGTARRTTRAPIDPT